MKVKELIERLSKFEAELDVYMFAEGKDYEPQIVQLIGVMKNDEIIRREVEIGCGWIEVEREDEDIYPIMEGLDE